MLHICTHRESWIAHFNTMPSAGSRQLHVVEREIGQEMRCQELKMN